MQPNTYYTRAEIATDDLLQLVATVALCVTTRQLLPVCLSLKINTLARDVSALTHTTKLR
jgi:hypothetical protein